MVAHIVRDDGVASSNLVTSTIRDGFSAVSFLLQNYAKMLKIGLNTEVLDGFSAVSFLLQNYAKMLKIGLNTEVLSTATIKLGKLEEKKLTRHKQSHKQSF